MMGSVIGVLVLAALFVLYTAALNGFFLACPYCGKIGSWRFESVAEPQYEHDEEDNLVSSSHLRRCRKCRGHVQDVWSDFEGREIRKSDS